MSSWTYINGTITVSPMGRTQAEKRYILDTVLEHLPLVTGSEEDMNVYIIQKNGTNSSCSCDEFGETTNNLVDRYGDKSRTKGWLEMQDEYILVIDASLRDRVFKQTFKEFQNWLCRLAKRVTINRVLVEVSGYLKSTIIRDDNDAYYDMFEMPSWANDDKEPTWCEYLMWDKAKHSDLPVMLEYKYYNNDENDIEAERRMDYFQSQLPKRKGFR